MTVWVKPCTYIIAVIALLVIPLPWVVGWLVAVSVHEASHWLAFWVLGVKVSTVTVAPFGIHMETAAMTEPEELISAAAGPVGGMCLLLLSKRFPQLAVCAFVQSMYNLIPVFPFDGGRIVRDVAICIWGHERGQRFYRRFEVCIMHILVLVFGVLSLKFGVFFAVFGLFLFLKILWGKNPLQRDKKNSTIYRNGF